MINIERHIQYLLIEHDCVIVPELGAFIVNREAARFSGALLLPPQRNIVFNPEVDHDDALLISSVARAESINYDNARRAVATEVNSLKHQLEQDGEIALNRVGRLRSETSGTISFIPDADSTASMLFKGMPAVKATRLIDKARQEAEEIEKKERKSAEIIYVPVSRNIFKRVASVAIVVMLGMLCTTTRMVDDSVYEASMNQNITAPSTIKKESPFVVNPVTVEETIAEVETVSETETFAEKFAEVKENGAQPVATTEDNGSFCVVVASLPNEKRAHMFIDSQKDGADLRILVQDGRYRVYAFTADNEDEAKSIAADKDIQKKYPGAWVCEIK